MGVRLSHRGNTALEGNWTSGVSIGKYVGNWESIVQTDVALCQTMR
jgi:hypothetical protein